MPAEGFSGHPSWRRARVLSSPDLSRKTAGPDRCPANSQLACGETGSRYLGSGPGSQAQAANIPLLSGLYITSLGPTYIKHTSAGPVQTNKQTARAVRPAVASSVGAVLSVLCTPSVPSWPAQCGTFM